MRNKTVLLVDFRSVVADFCAELSEALNEKGFDVTIIKEQQSINNVKNNSFIRALLIILRVFCYFLCFNRNHAIIFCWPPEYGFELFLAKLLCLGSNKKNYIIIHNYENHDTKKSYLKSMGAKFLREKITIITLSDNVYRKLSKDVQNSIIQCRHPIISKYGFHQKINSSKTATGKCLRLGSVGGVRPYKNIETLINYITLYRLASGHDVTLNILGEDKSHILNRFDVPWLIHLDTRFSVSDLKNFMQNIDVAVFAYENISQSGAVYLPLAFDTPVSCNDVGDFHEVLEIFGDSSLNLNLGSYRLFAHSMDMLFQRRNDFASLGKQQSSSISKARNRQVAFRELLKDLYA